MAIGKGARAVVSRARGAVCYGEWKHERLGARGGNLCRGHKSALWARINGLLVARWGMNTQSRSWIGTRVHYQARDMAQGHGASRGCDLKLEGNSQATAPWDGKVGVGATCALGAKRTFGPAPIGCWWPGGV